MGLPEAERMEKLADPAVRTVHAASERARSKEAGVFRGLADLGTYVIGDTYAAANEGCAFRRVADIAAERGTAPFDTLLDIVLADQLRTVLWPNTDDGDEASWGMRAAIWSDARAMVGGSDAGAHLDRMCGSNYPTAFLADCLRGRRLVPVEKAVQMITDGPTRGALRAARAGPGPRGGPAPGQTSFVFDPDDGGLGAAPPPRPRPPGRHAPALPPAPSGVRPRVLVSRVGDGEATARPTGAVPEHPPAFGSRHRVGRTDPGLNPRGGPGV